MPSNSVSTTGLVGYNPNDATQTSFLSSLALGETGTTPWAPVEGVGGTNLSSAQPDQYGFPQWSGFGGSHAAGTYQFQPGTWDPIAAQLGLNFTSPSDQSAGAWAYAQQTYQQKTGGSLYDALQSGNYSSVQSALQSVWPSVTGNSATGGKTLAENLASGIGATLNLGSTGASQVFGTAPGQTVGGSSGSVLSSIEGFFVRGGLIVVGAIVLLIALWQMLSQHSALPSPGDTVKAAGKLAAM